MIRADELKLLRARPLGAWALAACAVGPGFEFADFRFFGGPAGDADLL